MLHGLSCAHSVVRQDGTTARGKARRRRVTSAPRRKYPWGADFFISGFLGARMCRIVDFCQMLKIQMGVNLRSGDAGVAEHILYGAQVA